MRTRLAGPLAAALLAGGPAYAQGGASQRPADAVVVNPGDRSGGGVSTRFETKPDRRYRVTVSGAFTFNGSVNFADCGHWDSESPTGWQSEPTLLLDGMPAACTRMPYHRTHTYCWLQAGTGRPFTFSLQTPRELRHDDYGALVVLVQTEPPAAAAATSPACHAVP